MANKHVRCDPPPLRPSRVGGSFGIWVRSSHRGCHDTDQQIECHNRLLGSDVLSHDGLYYRLPVPVQPLKAVGAIRSLIQIR